MKILEEAENTTNPAIFIIDIQFAYKAFEYELDVLDYIVKKPEYFNHGDIDFRLRRRLDMIFFQDGRNVKEESKTFYHSMVRGLKLMRD